MRSIRGTPAVILIVALVAATLSCNTKSNPISTATKADVVISIRANSSQMGSRAFSPSPDTVAVGTKVAWKNRDFMIHTATQKAGAFQWDTGNIAPGSTSIAVTMTTPGTYSYSCTVMMHNMTGVLVVR